MSTALSPTPSVEAAAEPAGELVLRDGSTVRLSRSDPELGADWARMLARDGAGRVVGRAAYARVYGPRAELTLVVDDDHWDRGLADALLHRLSAGAAEHGITTFLARVRARDVRLLALLRRAGETGETVSEGRVDVALATQPRSGRPPPG